MPYVEIDFRDGHYTVRVLATPVAGPGVRYVEGRVYDAWLVHLQQSAVFEALWRAYDNEPRLMQEKLHEFTCVYPQPGCDLTALPHAEWRIVASTIVTNYKLGSSKYQGCCCGHTHVKLDDAQVTALRAAGFIVEHDAEVP